VPSVSEVTTV